MADEVIAEFKPNRWRLLWRLMVLGVFMAFLASSVGVTRWSQSDIFRVVIFASLYCLIMYVKGPKPEEMLITISNREISGPPVNGQQRTIIPIEDIEIVLSQHLQGGFDGLANRRWLYSTDSKKIMVLCDGFPKGTFEQILDTIVRLQREAVTLEQAAQV
jgi:hypothetical protein